MRVLFAVLVSLVASGCATTPVPLSAARRAPPERVLAYQTGGGETSATLTIVRDEGYLGSGCYYAVYINRIFAARLDVAEYARFLVEPGEVLIRVGRDPQGKALCAADQDNWTQRETVLRAGEQKAFRMSIDVNGKLDVHRSDM